MIIDTHCIPGYWTLQSRHSINTSWIWMSEWVAFDFSDEFVSTITDRLVAQTRLMKSSFSGSPRLTHHSPLPLFIPSLTHPKSPKGAYYADRVKSRQCINGHKSWHSCPPWTHTHSGGHSLGDSGAGSDTGMERSPRALRHRTVRSGKFGQRRLQKTKFNFWAIFRRRETQVSLQATMRMALCNCTLKLNPEQAQFHHAGVAVVWPPYKELV